MSYLKMECQMLQIIYFFIWIEKLHITLMSFFPEFNSIYGNKPPEGS